MKVSEMDLRDYFAAQIVGHLASRYNRKIYDEHYGAYLEDTGLRRCWFAKEAYEIAEEMLVQRLYSKKETAQ